MEYLFFCLSSYGATIHFQTVCTMKKIPFPILALLLLPAWALAQFARRPVIDITANPQSWSNRHANICAQFMTIRGVGVCVSGGFHASEAVQGNFLTQSTTWDIHAETRIFPFGEPYPLDLKNKMRPYEKRRRGVGCFSTKGNRMEKAIASILPGIYVAPGFVHQEEQLVFTPLPGKESPIRDFSYLIKNNGASLAMGCQIRLWHLTFGAGWSMQATKPRWTGPVDIFGDALYYQHAPLEIERPARPAP